MEIIDDDFPSIYLVQCNSWQKIPSIEKKVLFSDDYLVIKHGLDLVFAKQADIDQVSLHLTSHYRKNNGDWSHMMKDLFTDIQSMQQPKIPFALINMGALRTQTTEDDFSIALTNEYNLNIAEKGESRSNVIQVTFTVLAFLWDLDEHKEVTFLTKPQEFNSPDSYVPNGFVPFAFRNYKNQKMNDIKYFK